MSAVTIDSLEIKLQTNGAKGTRALSGLSSSMDRLGKASGNATLSFAKVVSKISVATLAIKKIGTAIGKSIKEVSNYTENINLFNVSMGQYAEEAGAYAKKVESALGIDVSEFARNQGVFMTLSTGFGVAGDRAHTMSQQLTQLGYDISSFYNIDVADAMQKLQSGLAGELEPLRRLGYDLSQAKLEATALELGITKNVKAMTQAEKAQLRYHAIMTQVTQSHGDMARTIESPANQLRILTAQFTRTSRAIGSIFIPALTAVLPYVNAIMQVVEQLASAIAGLFGYKAPEFKNFDNAAAGASDIADGLDDATSAAKKLKSYTMGFDELNVIDPNSGSSGKDEGGGGWVDFDLTQYDFLGEATGNKITGIVDNIKEKFREVIVVTDELQYALDSIGTEKEIPISVGMVAESVILTAQNIFFTLMDYLNELLYGTNWSSIGNTIGELLGNAIMSIDFSGIVNRLQGFRLGIQIAILELLSGSINGVNWGELLNYLVVEIGELIRGIGELDWSGFGVSLANLFNSIFNAIGEVDWGKLGEDIANLIPIAFDAIGEAVSAMDWGEIVSSMFEALGAAVAGLTELAIGFGKEFLQLIVDVWNDVVAYFDEKIKECGGDVALGILTGIGDFFADIWNWIVENIFNPFIEGFKDIFDINSPSKVMEELGGFIAEGLLQGIKDAWADITAFFSELWEDIKTFASDCWDGVVEVWNSATGWFDETIITPLTETFTDFWDSLTGWATDCWEGIKSVFSDVGEFFSETFTKAWEGIVGVFSIAGDIFNDIKDGVVDAFFTVVNGIIGGINKVVKVPFDAINGVLKWLRDIEIAGITPFSGIKLITVPQIPKIEMKAEGGMVDTGQMFIAREAGPELVGTIGNKTAVVNNEQIIQGIATGVSVANSESNALLREQNSLLLRLLEKETGFYLDGKDISNSVDKYKRERGRQIVAGGAY